MGFGNAKAERPYTKTIKWRSSESRFEYYDGENNQTIEIESFIPLEEMASVSGYHDGQKQGIWSNEVLDLRNDLEVRAGNSVVVTGPWKNIKTEVAGMGGKFTNVVIALMPDGEIVRFLFAGSGCSGWIGKKFNPMQKQCGVSFDGSHEEKTGRVTYNVPDFSPKRLNDEETIKAMESWKLVDSWLNDKGIDRAEMNQDVEHDHNQDDPNADANAAFQQAEEVPF